MGNSISKKLTAANLLTQRIRRPRMRFVEGDRGWGGVVREEANKEGKNVEV